MSTTITLYATKDSFVDSANPTTNYGATNYLEVEDAKRAWIGFDLSSIPSGSYILSAVLSVRPFYSGLRSMNIQRCTDLTWTENGITWNNAPNASCIADQDILPLIGYGSSSYQDFEVTSLIQSALSSGGISWRIKTDIAGGYNNFCWLSAKEYAPTGCSKLVITYASSGTAVGFIDVPASTDGYIDGTDTSDSFPYSRGLAVYTGTSDLHIYNSSSAGREKAMPYAYYNTLLSNLQALGLPVGATITKREWRTFCNHAFGAGEGADMNFAYSSTGVLGTTITLNDWNFPGCTLVYIGSVFLEGTGWKIYELSAINLSGYTNCGYLTGAGGTTAPNYASLSGTNNSDENAPVLRIYYEYTIASTTIPKQFSLAPHLIRFGREDNNMLIRGLN